MKYDASDYTNQMYKAAAEKEAFLGAVIAAAKVALPAVSSLVSKAVTSGAAVKATAFVKSPFVKTTLAGVGTQMVADKALSSVGNMFSGSEHMIAPPPIKPMGVNYPGVRENSVFKNNSFGN